MPLSKITGNSFSSTANTNIDNGLLFLNPTANAITSIGVAHFGTSNSSPISDESVSIRNNASHALSIRSDSPSLQAQIIFQGNVRRYQLGVGNSQMAVAANNFYVYNASTAHFPWQMQPDNYIKTPYQPACKVLIDSGGNTLGSGAGSPTVLTSSVATFTKSGNRDVFDRTNSFDTTNGRFTAPVAGAYFIGVNFLRNNTAGSGATIRFAKNGTATNIYARYYRPGNSWAYETTSLATITTLEIGDYIHIINTDPYTVSFYNDDSYFFAYFLG